MWKWAQNLKRPTLEKSQCQLPWLRSYAQASNMKLYEESEMQEGATTGGPEAQELTMLRNLTIP
jgi:hypothetical protein